MPGKGQLTKSHLLKKNKLKMLRSRKSKMKKRLLPKKPTQIKEKAMKRVTLALRKNQNKAIVKLINLRSQIGPWWV